jgi:oligo-1,6-glucosidase
MDEFGSLSDWEEMLQEVNKKDMKLVMDLVVNHTSDEHKWFVESRKSKDNHYKGLLHLASRKRWERTKQLVLFFSGSAWEYDETTGEYYLHLFSKKQPDLN